jgi:caffeoyl-CoA O-methyltransferase
VSSGAEAAPPPRPVTPIGIAGALLEQVAEQLRHDGADPAVLADLERATALVSGLEPYLARCTTPESDALRRLAGRTREQDWVALRQEDGPALEQEMLSGHVEGQLLKLLVRLVGATRVLDVGTFTGYSALAMAEAIPDDGQVVACELDAQVAAMARRSFDEVPAGQRIDVEVGPALDTLRRLADEGASFDVAFIDADKGGYLDYLGALLDGRLVRPGGLICVDNTLLQGQTYVVADRTELGGAVDTFNRAVAADPRVDQVLLPLRDGITLARVAVPT